MAQVGVIRVGVIGLGKMGLPIAQNLIERGFAVTGYRRSGSPELEQAGGTVAGSPAEVAASADVLLSILPGAEDVEQVTASCSDLVPESGLAVHVDGAHLDVDGARSQRGQGAGRAADDLLDVFGAGKD